MALEIIGPRHTTGSLSFSRNIFIDMTLMPPRLVSGSMPPLADLLGAPFVPNMRAILGPVISPSRMPTRWPCRRKETASRPVTSDFPTPPLPLIIAITCLILRSGAPDAIVRGTPRPTGAFFGATEMGSPLTDAFKSYQLIELLRRKAVCAGTHRFPPEKLDQ